MSHQPVAQFSGGLCLIALPELKNLFRYLRCHTFLHDRQAYNYHAAVWLPRRRGVRAPETLSVYTIFNTLCPSLCVTEKLMSAIDPKLQTVNASSVDKLFTVCVRYRRYANRPRTPTWLEIIGIFQKSVTCTNTKRQNSSAVIYKTAVKRE